MELEVLPPQFESNGKDSYYSPCEMGLHFCGQTEYGKDAQPYTALNIKAKDKGHARRMYEAAKSVS